MAPTDPTVDSPFFRRRAKLLWPLAGLYGAAARLRRRLFAWGWRRPDRLPWPVISVGNITAGGTGKTPLTIYLAERIRQKGVTPLILSRGYKGSASAKGGLVSDGRNILMDVRQAGDEPYMMAALLPGVPVVVGRRRFQAARQALTRLSPGAIILDDGFQHFQLARDLDLVLLDQTRPLDNHCLLPAGLLREPVDSLKAADAIVFTRCDLAAAPRIDPALTPWITNKPTFRTCHRPYVVTLVEPGRTPSTGPATTGFSELPPHQGAFVFCGLARNREFLAAVGQLTGQIVGQAFFPDHHFYSTADLQTLSARAKALGADLMVTSHKDYAKIAGRGKLTANLAVLGVKVEFPPDDAARLDKLLTACLSGQNGKVRD